MRVPPAFSRREPQNLKKEKTKMKAMPLLTRLIDGEDLSREELTLLLSSFDEEDKIQAAERAREIALSRFGNKIFIRGIIEFSNYCKNDCLYCGIRKSNRCASRYRLEDEEILSCCENGYQLGFRTFVLQSGEDPGFSDKRLERLVRRIRALYPDCAITLSVGEKSRETYQRFFDAGANRYLLRHETANPQHYSKLHPPELHPKNRIRCLKDLKEIGFQTGCGSMIGSPYQTFENLAEDLLFMKEFRPHMIGTGPFIPHKDTPFCDKAAGSAELTLFFLSILRIMHPNVLLPATTALGTLRGNGRQLGILSGANVVMPNLSPLQVREKYLLYDNKIGTGEEAAENIQLLRKSIAEIGYELVLERGDYDEHRGEL